MIRFKLRARFSHFIGAALVLISSAAGIAQQPGAPGGLPVVMLSDLHFDPFHDPAKLPLLVKAPVTGWRKILDSPATPAQQARFGAVQEACNGKDGEDSSWTLVRSALSAAKANAASAAFVTVSGDLLVHDLDCRYRASMGMPASNVDDQSATAGFAEKTTAFVMTEIESAFPQLPVYLALGNNDSRCNHNRMDAHDEYLTAAAPIVIDGLRGVSAAEKSMALQTFGAAGYYAVTMPAPMQNTRLIVINDVYMMPKYTNCKAEGEDHKGEGEQTAWLQKQFEEARSRHGRVWLIGHLPPAVNPESSLAGNASFCTNGKVVRFQTTDDLANQLTANADTVKLGIFGHTHMDELHLLRGKNGAVPIKVVGAVSPVSGNLPSFTVGMVDPASATLADYTVYEASNATGVAAKWRAEYTFDAAYGEAGFTPAPLADLIARMQADTAGMGKDSRAYQEHFLKGSAGKKLSPSWPGYVCSLGNSTAKSFKSCVCAAATP